jgi:hypothetical protein
MKKLILCIVLSVIAYGILSLPDPLDEKGFGNLTTELNFDRLPDVDLRVMAEQEWAAERKETAIAILDYMVEENMGDAPSAKILRDQYLDKIKSDDSPTGRLRAAGYGFLTGKVDDVSSLAGSTVGDYFLYGDFRDVVRETVFEDDTDEIVVALSAVGIVTTIFPPAEGAVDVMKALKKVSALSASMVNVLKRMLKGFKELPNPLKRERIKEIFMPFKDLWEKCSSWGQYITIVRYSDNLRHLKIFTTLASTPENAKKLSTILAVAGSGNQGKKIATEVIDHLGNYGQKGMNNLYALLRKGPSGISFIAKHPSLVARSLKNTKKASPFLTNSIVDQWQAFAFKYKLLSSILKYIVAFFIIAFVVIIFISTILRTFGKVDNSPSGKNTILKLAAGAAVAVILVVLLSNPSSKDYLSQQANVLELTGGQSQFSPKIQQDFSQGLLFFFILFAGMNIGFQVYWYSQVKKKVKEISDQSIEVPTRLSLLDNLDIYFDLPMYIGFVMTICAFLLITVSGAESARLWAYSATLIGIVGTVILRFTILHKERESLISENQNGSSKEIEV